MIFRICYKYCYMGTGFPEEWIQLMEISALYIERTVEDILNQQDIPTTKDAEIILGELVKIYKIYTVGRNDVQYPNYVFQNVIDSLNNTIKEISVRSDTTLDKFTSMVYLSKFVNQILKTIDFDIELQRWNVILKPTKKKRDEAMERLKRSVSLHQSMSASFDKVCDSVNSIEKNLLSGLCGCGLRCEIATAPLPGTAASVNKRGNGYRSRRKSRHKNKSRHKRKSRHKNKRS